MKNFKKYTALSTILGGLLAVSISTAYSDTVQLNSIVGVGGVDLTASISDGIAILNGTVDSHVESEITASYVQRMEGVDKVINNIYVD